MQAGDERDEEVLTRAYLVFENARKFNINTHGRDIHTYAEELKARFNKALDKVPTVGKYM